MKKFFITLMCIIMVVCFMPTVAWAGTEVDCPGGESCTHYAAIGNTHYDTLAGAINNAENEETVKLLRDVTQNVSVNGDKDIIFDLNEKTLTGYITHYKSGHLTVKNGTVAGTIWVKTSATDEVIIN